MTDWLLKSLLLLSSLGTLVPQAMQVCHCEAANHQGVTKPTQHFGLPGLNCCCTQASPHANRGCTDTGCTHDKLVCQNDGQPCSDKGHCCDRPAPPLATQSDGDRVELKPTVDYFTDALASLSVCEVALFNRLLDARPPAVDRQKLLCRWIL